MHLVSSSLTILLTLFAVLQIINAAPTRYESVLVNGRRGRINRQKLIPGKMFKGNGSKPWPSIFPNLKNKKLSKAKP